MQKIDDWARYLVVCVLLLLAAVGTLSGRGLYADGPFWLYQMLINNGLYIFDIHRAYAQFLVELPVYIAILMGVVDLNSLIRVHSFGLVALPLIVWCYALLLQFRTPAFWLLALTCAVTNFRSGFFAAGEFNTAYALVALCVAILLKPNVTRFQSVVLLAASIVLTHAYETMLFIGLFLVMVCAVRLGTEKQDSKFTKCVLLAVSGLYLFAVFVGVRSTFFHRTDNLQATINYGAIFEPHILYLLAMILCVVLSVVGGLQKSYKAVIALGALAITMLYGMYIWRWDQSGISYGYYSYAYRSLGAFMLVGILFITWLICTFPKLTMRGFVKVSVPHLAATVLLIFLLQGAVLFGHSIGYYQWLKQFERAALIVDGLVPIDHVPFNKGQGSISGYNWPWSNSALSVLLRGNAESIIINASNFDGWETFDPKTINKYPLKAYTKASPLYP